MERHFPGEYQLVPDGDGAAAQLEEIYRELAARRHAAERRSQALRAAPRRRAS